MDRLAAFEQLKNHAWLGRLFLRLTKADIELCRAFIVSQEKTPKVEFELAVNRMFLDKPKPKNHTVILELLSCANSSSGK